jgi:hypothetical protein
MGEIVWEHYEKKLETVLEQLRAETEALTFFSAARRLAVKILYSEAGLAALVDIFFKVGGWVIKLLFAAHGNEEEDYVSRKTLVLVFTNEAKLGRRGPLIPLRLCVYHPKKYTNLNLFEIVRSQ